MAKSLRKNYVYSASYQLLSIITPFITTPYLSRTLKAEGVGTASFINSVVQNFLLFAQMGIYSYGRREVSYAQDDRQKRSWIFWNLKALAFINASISMTAFLVMSYFYAGDSFYLYLISGFQIINVFLNVGWLYEGLEEFRDMVMKNTIVRICNVLFLVTCVKSRADLPLYLGGHVVFEMLGHLVMWTKLPKFIGRPRLRAITPYHDFKTIWMLFLPGIAAEVYTVLDKIMIGLFTGEPAENGYYEFAVRIARIVLALIIAQSSVMIPRIGRLFAEHNTEKIKEHLYKSYGFVWFLGVPMCLGLVGISDNFVPWFFGPGFLKVAGLIKITGFLIMAISLGSVTGGQCLVPTRRHNLYTLTICIGAVVNFCFNIVFIRLFKSYGAAVASVIAESSIAASQLYILRRELDARKIFALGVKNIIAGVVMLCVVLFMSSKMRPSAANTFILIPSGAAVYFVSLLVMRDSFFITNASRTLNAIAKRLHIKQ